VKVRVLLLAAVLAAPALPRDREFDAVVKGIEMRYQVRRTRIPFMGLANALLFVARPAGASGIKMAVFENASLLDRADEFQNSLRATLGPQWRPFIETHSQRENETTTIYSRVDGKRLHLLIATVERNEVSVLRCRVSTGALKNWVYQPVRTARGGNKNVAH
jgi:hypothetical protein